MSYGFTMIASRNPLAAPVKRLRINTLARPDVRRHTPWKPGSSRHAGMSPCTDAPRDSSVAPPGACAGGSEKRSVSLELSLRHDSLGNEYSAIPFSDSLTSTTVLFLLASVLVVLGDGRLDLRMKLSRPVEGLHQSTSGYACHFWTAFTPFCKNLY
jgi:hypothetical protein